MDGKKEPKVVNLIVVVFDYPIERFISYTL